MRTVTLQFLEPPESVFTTGLPQGWSYSASQTYPGHEERMAAIQARVEAALCWCGSGKLWSACHLGLNLCKHCGQQFYADVDKRVCPRCGSRYVRSLDEPPARKNGGKA